MSHSTVEWSARACDERRVSLPVELVVDCRKFVDCNALGLTAAALSSYDPPMRAAAYSVLAAYYSHVEGARFREQPQVSGRGCAAETSVPPSGGQAVERGRPLHTSCPGWAKRLRFLRLFLWFKLGAEGGCCPATVPGSRTGRLMVRPGARALPALGHTRPRDVGSRRPAELCSRLRGARLQRCSLLLLPGALPAGCRAQRDPHAEHEAHLHLGALRGQSSPADSEARYH